MLITNLRKLPCLGIDNLFLDYFAIVLKNSMNFLYANEISKNGRIKDSNSTVAFVCTESQQKL